jgi:hypothetical protein
MGQRLSVLILNILMGHPTRIFNYSASMNYFKAKTDARDARGKCGQEKLKKTHRKLLRSRFDREW